MDKLSSYYFYLFVFGLTIGFALLQEKFYQWKGKDAKILSFFIVMLPSLLAGLRFHVGTDYQAYVNHTRAYSSMTLPVYWDKVNWELGHYLLIQLNRIFDTPYLMFFVASLLTMNFFYEGLLYYRKKISLPIGVMLYLLTFFPHSLNVIRQYLAVSILFYGYQYIFKKNFGKYLVAVTLASSFHLTAVAALPFYFFHHKFAVIPIPVPKKIQGKPLFPQPIQTCLLQARALEVFLFLKIQSLCNPHFTPHYKPHRQATYPLDTPLQFPKKIKIPYVKTLVYLFLVLLVFYFEEILTVVSEIEVFSKYTSYITRERDGANREIYLSALILFGMFSFRRELKTHDPRNEFFVSMLVVGFLLGFLGYIDADIKRIALYFDISRIVLLASFPKLYQSRELKTLFTCGLLIYGVFFFFLMFYYLEHSDIFPYRSILGEGEPLDGSMISEFIPVFLADFFKKEVG